MHPVEFELDDLFYLTLKNHAVRFVKLSLERCDFGLRALFVAGTDTEREMVWELGGRTLNNLRCPVFRGSKRVVSPLRNALSGDGDWQGLGARGFVLRPQRPDASKSASIFTPDFRTPNLRRWWLLRLSTCRPIRQLRYREQNQGTAWQAHMQ